MGNATLKKSFRRMRLFYLMARHNDSLHHRCLSLRSQAEEVRSLAVVMRDIQSQRAMFRMADAYDMMARLLEKTWKHVSVTADTDAA
jgi:uncharacterized protein YigA (DUF484 family)